MAILRERIVTALPTTDAFHFIADFANASEWDPGVATSGRVDAGPLRVGTRFQLGVRLRGRVSRMDYRVTVLEPGRRVVLAGSGSGVDATDDIRFTPTPSGGTAIDYMADIRLRGVLRLLAPFAGGAFATLARNARDGMQLALDARAATASDPESVGTAAATTATSTSASVGAA